MASSYDEKIEDVLADSELARRLVPNKFKFTSQQGRLRRQKLLAAAKELSATRPISQITLADVCEKADIPRASAYHFFPNVEAIFLALRFLNAMEIFKKLEAVDSQKYSRWQAYVTALVDTGVEVIQADPTVARLIYETNTPDFEGNAFGSEIEKEISNLVYDKLSAHYKMPNLDTIKQQLLVAYGLVNGVFTLAYRSEQKITDSYRQEAITAVIAYLRCYLPENLPKAG
ncbi:MULTISPECIES: TetR/AcrR family transcriptional regulator [unclassified Moraxella]|uniref:TetR/AcrR family transcriptional regulator n=1 Tax=unclassified Moraxella TaxID=2685852 RepID=UPI003AF53400